MLMIICAQLYSSRNLAPVIHLHHSMACRHENGVAGAAFVGIEGQRGVRSAIRLRTVYSALVAPMRWILGSPCFHSMPKFVWESLIVKELRIDPCKNKE